VNESTRSRWRGPHHVSLYVRLPASTLAYRIHCTLIADFLNTKKKEEICLEYLSNRSLRYTFEVINRNNLFFSVALRPNAGHGLHIIKVSISRTTTLHTRLDSSGRVIGPSQRPVPAQNTQQSQQTNIRAPLARFEPTIPGSERPQTRAFDRVATGID
jgi:hypothetical protein